MLNDNTRKILNSLNKITNTISLKYPVTTGVSESMDTCFQVDLSELDSDGFEHEIVLINNFDKFLSLFNLFKDPKTTINNDIVTLKSDRKKLDFIMSDKLLLKSNIDESIFEKVSSANSVCTFTLDAETIKDILKGCAVLKDLNEIIFITNEEEKKCTLSLGNTSSFNTRFDSYAFDLDANVSKSINIRLPVSTFSKLPLLDYDVECKYSSKTNKHVLLLKVKNFNNFKMVLSVLNNS